MKKKTEAPPAGKIELEPADELAIDKERLTDMAFNTMLQALGMYGLNVKKMSNKDMRAFARDCVRLNVQLLAEINDPSPEPEIPPHDPAVRPPTPFELSQMRKNSDMGLVKP